LRAAGRWSEVCRGTISGRGSRLSAGEAVRPRVADLLAAAMARSRQPPVPRGETLVRVGSSANLAKAVRQSAPNWTPRCREKIRGSRGLFHGKPRLPIRRYELKSGHRKPALSTQKHPRRQNRRDNQPATQRRQMAGPPYFSEPPFRRRNTRKQRRCRSESRSARHGSSTAVRDRNQDGVQKQVVRKYEPMCRGKKRGGISAKLKSRIGCADYRPC